MKSKLKLFLGDSLSLFDKKTFTYLILSLLLLNIYRILDTNPNYGIFNNLIFDINNKYYTFIFVSVITYFVILIINKLKNRIEISTRFEKKEEQFQYILKNIVIICIEIFIINLSILVIMRLIKHKFTLVNETYILYDINSNIYLLISILKMIIYVLTYSYLLVSFEFYTRNRYFSYIIYILTYISLITSVSYTIDSTPLKLMFYSSYISYYNYANVLNEILYFICSTILKLYLIGFVNCILKNFKKIKIGKILLIIYNFLKKIIVPLTIYIAINIINLYLLKISGMNVDSISVLSLGNLKNVSFVSYSTKCISMLLFVYIVCKILIKYTTTNSSIYFTRIKKTKWFNQHFMYFMFLLFIYRAPLYLFTGLNLNVFVDILVYIILLIGTFNYIYYLRNFDLYFLIMLLAVILILNIKIITILSISIIIVIYLLINYLIKNKN